MPGCSIAMAQDTPRSISSERAVHDADRHERRSLGSGCTKRWQSRWASSIVAHVIGPRRDIVDHHGDWARAREVGPTGGCVLVRPDQHVCLARRGMAENPEAELTRVLAAILHRDHRNPPARRRSERNGHGSARTGVLHRRKLSRRRDQPQRQGADERLAQVMEVITRKHLHAAVKEIEPTQEEWFEAIMFLTETGQMCNDWRQEFILLSDVLGVSMLVDAINNRKPTGASESTVLGPFHVADAPELPMGANICLDQKGDPMLVKRTHPRYRRQADRSRQDRCLAGQ
jgi:hypothetical protein